MGERTRWPLCFPRPHQNLLTETDRKKFLLVKKPFTCLLSHRIALACDDDAFAITLQPAQILSLAPCPQANLQSPPWRPKFLVAHLFRGPSDNGRCGTVHPGPHLSYIHIMMVETVGGRNWLFSSLSALLPLLGK